MSYLTKTQYYNSGLKTKHQINWDSFLSVLKIIIYIFSKLYLFIFVAY